MDKQAKGAWIINHTQKLNQVDYADGFENLILAGKCGIFLSSISASDESIISLKKAETFAKAQKINPKLELPSILENLKKERLIDIGEDEIHIIGLTQSSVLEHATNIFDQSTDNPEEDAAISLSEKISEIPLLQSEAMNFLIKDLSIRQDSAALLLNNSETYTLFDAEEFEKVKVYFNGNLFRKDDPIKLGKILLTLNPEEKEKYLVLQVQLKKAGCLELTVARDLIGVELLNKLQTIGGIDLNEVSNNSENVTFITLPSAFNKFGNSQVEDSFDHSKALVSSLTYGMTKSVSSRGKITMIDRLLNRLVQGDYVGPATAIGEDYKALEMKGIIHVREEPYGRFSMKLLKREVGEIAQKIFSSGDSSDIGVVNLPQASLNEYTGPESTRTRARRSQKRNNGGVQQMLLRLRTGK